uniref:Uncharacterized protein n=1 Tax=Parascaris univalens TaxID=6257 RepID=A0A914ZE66_PARUN
MEFCGMIHCYNDGGEGKFDGKGSCKYFIYMHMVTRPIYKYIYIYKALSMVNVSRLLLPFFPSLKELNPHLSNRYPHFFIKLFDNSVDCAFKCLKLHIILLEDEKKFFSAYFSVNNISYKVKSLQISRLQRTHSSY